MTLLLKLGAWAVLVAVLVASPAFPEITNTLAVIGMVIALPVMIFDLVTKRWRPGWRDLVPVLALVLFGLALIPTTRSPDNYAVLLALLPLALSVPLSRLLARLGPALNMTTVSLVAFAGAAVAAGVSAYALLVLGVRRAGLTMNPIHLGDLALGLAFLSLAGIFSSRSKWRWLLLLGPVFGFLAVYWSGSRGPLLSFGVLAVVFAVCLVVFRLPRRRRAPALFAFLVAGIVGSYGLYVSGVLSALPGTREIVSLASGDIDALDNSTAMRLQMYEGGWKAFLASPVFGHGQGYTDVAATFVERSDVVSATPHLHSDIINFMAIAGVLGLLAYMLLIAASFFAVGANAGQAALFVALVVAIGYVSMGLTNAMFGILVLTNLYAVTLAVLLQHQPRQAQEMAG